MSDLSVVPQRCVLVLPSAAEFDSRTYRIASTLSGRGHDVTGVARISPGLPEASADGWGDEEDLPRPPRRGESGGRAGAGTGSPEYAALVLLGFGRSFERECARDREPRFAGRHLTLPARHPDELLGWTAAADVALVPLPLISINQRLSSPNKFWEALVAGTPVVVPVPLSYMAEIVRERDLGIVAASAGAADLALAISACLARLATDPGWRARIRATTGRDYTWPVAATTYRKGIARLA
jgi:hypothetical protein